MGQYIALHQGKLVDHDTDGCALSLRIYQSYPNQFVLICQVEELAETIIKQPNTVTKAAMREFDKDVRHKFTGIQAILAEIGDDE